MNIVIKNNKICKIESEDQKQIKAISNLLSYKQSGVEYTQAFKNGWDGITRLLNKKNEFGIGLLNRLKLYLDKNNISYSIEDKRKEPTKIESISVNDIGMIPRDYQERCVQSAIDNDRGIIRGAVGCGKSFIAALITAYFNKNTIIYVIGLDLLQQFHDLFSKLFNEEIGWIGNGVVNPKRITIASIWTLGSALELKGNVSVEDEVLKELPLNIQDKVKVLRSLKETSIHIIDECHVCTCDTLQQIYKYINPERIYGLSGTPFRDDGSDLLTEAMLGSIISDVSASELIEKKVLAQPVIKFVNVPGKTCSMRTYQEVYKDYIVENEIRNSIIVSQTKSLIEKKYIPLVLFKTIDHGKKLYNLFIENGINCELLFGNDSLDKRNETKRKLNSGEINCIVASTIFDIGLDLPKLSGLVLAGSGKSRVRILQRIGRVIRKNSQFPKEKAAVVDFMDNVRFLDKHSKIRFDTYTQEKGFKILGN